MSTKLKSRKKQNKPYYMNDGGKVEIGPKKEKIESIPVKKFQLGIDKNGNPLVTIDNTIHFFNNTQFHAFTLGIINVAKKINPEIDY